MTVRLFKIMTTRSQPHGARWHEFLSVEVIDAMTYVTSMMKHCTEPSPIFQVRINAE